jgi:3-phosphoshikimate 1-carboxyvinyltransferase
MKPLLDVLIDQGICIEYLGKSGFLPIHMKSNGIKGGRVQVEMKDSSQFVSGLLLASSYAKTPLIIDQNLEAKPYVQMTLRMIKDFAMPLRKGEERLYLIEPDASTASYFFAAAALTGGRVTVPGLSFCVMQGDIRFLKVLEKMGAILTEEQEGVTVQGPPVLKGLGWVDMTGFTDTFMTLAAIAPFADASTTITGLRHTRLQESDRVEAMRQGLNALGARVTTTEESITIHPSTLHGGYINSHNDHRIAMSHALIGLKIPGVIIDGADCVKKTCPSFFNLLASLTK